MDVNELTSKFGDYVAVSVIPGPNDKPSKTVDDENKDLKENKRIIARVEDFKHGLSENIGISRDLSVALNIENQIGNIVSLKPAIRNLPKRPTTFTIHPYIIHTKKKEHTINKKDNKILQQLTEKLYPDIASMAITNFIKIPIVPNILPYGGLLKFRKNDDYNAWIKPYNLDSKKPIKLEIGDELLRPQSYIEQPPQDTTDLEVIGLDQTVEGIVDSFATSENTGTLIHGNSGSGKRYY